MPISSYLKDRCQSQCELCSAASDLDTYIVPPRKGEELDEQVALCSTYDQVASVIHKDSNGNVLANGDTVTLIQDLNVKGAGFTAKRGTAVRRIRLVPDNANHIEGKVDGQHIVILTQYVKKS